MGHRLQGVSVSELHLEDPRWRVRLTNDSGLPHSADPEEIDDLEKYLNAAIPPLGEGDKKPDGSL